MDMLEEMVSKGRLTLSVRAVMKAFEVRDVATIRRWVRSHGFPKARRLGGRNRWLLSELIAWASAQPVAK